jgi:hypothetical protein
MSRWPPTIGTSTAYNLPGPQVEPNASFWGTGACPPPCVIHIPELIKVTDDEKNPCYFPPYPNNTVTEKEIEELFELASIRDDPEALVGGEGELRRRAISPFLQLRPQPLGAVYNRIRDPSLPVIQTGRELARWFEGETPGLGHRHALNSLMPTSGWSPPQQARVWMALDVAIYSALLAAWYYKWYSSSNPGHERTMVSFRPRPIEFDPRISVLFNFEVNSTGSGDGARRLHPEPSPGTPRHPSYPSGHSTVGGAASEILSYFFPDYYEEFTQLADNAGMARLWAGIHYRSDHIQGMKLGRCVAQLIIRHLEEGCVPPYPTPNCKKPLFPPECELPPSPDEIKKRAAAQEECCKGKGSGPDASGGVMPT